MLEQILELQQGASPPYPSLEHELPFADYIAQCRALIQNRRPDLKIPNTPHSLILDANSPYELMPANPILSGQRIKYGVLLIHGLLDSPFSLRDVGEHLQANGMLCRSILLPGHGTQPSDLLSVSYHDWIKAVRYGVDSLRNQVERIYLVGYSTGATLSLYQALQDSTIAGVILLAPAIRIKAPISVVVAWHYLKKWLHINHNLWLQQESEMDYAKYLSIGFNPVTQVAALTQVLRSLQKQRPLTCPVFMTLSREDETISSDKAIRFFKSLPNPRNQLLLYTGQELTDNDPRIHTRFTYYPEWHIEQISHVALPFSPTNTHYGQHGDYQHASHINSDPVVYGAHNRIAVDLYEWLYRFKLITQPRRELTYNPDFDYMAEQICQFILA